MSRPTIIVEVGVNPAERKRVFDLLGESLKRGSISRLPNGRWELLLPIGSSNQIRAYTRSRRDAESAVDELMKLLGDPETARATYAYLRALSARAELGGFEIAGDMFTPGGQIHNIDAKSEVLQ